VPTIEADIDFMTYSFLFCVYDPTNFGSRVTTMRTPYDIMRIH